MEFTDAPLEPFGKTLLDIQIPSQLSFKTPIVYRIIKDLKAAECLPWTGTHRAELCFDEAITNAMMHGNRLNPDRKVKVVLFADAERWGAIIEDEGEGFTAEALISPDAPEFLFTESGRGIHLMDSWLDSLSYSRKGNRLMMIRARQNEPEATEAEAALAPEAEIGSEAVALSELGGIQIVQVNNERLYDENVDDFRKQTAAALEAGNRIIVDLAPVGYVSSVGLSSLVNVFKNAQAKQAKLILCGVQPGVRDILKSSHLLQLFTIAPDQKTALAQAGKP